MRGKLIVIEGTDCSGKETQTNLLMDYLRSQNIHVNKFSFPNYSSPTGKIVGGPYLGKSYICEGWFSEGASNLDPKVSSLYFAADRKYNIHKIQLLLENGSNVILDRYVYSNMAHQGGKITDGAERSKLYGWIDTLEFELLELPHADIKIFLHLPYKESIILRKGRAEEADQHEASEDHLMHAEKAYLEVSQKYDFHTIECGSNGNIRTIEDINNDVITYVMDELNKQIEKTL